jgi:hypothetical protein
VGHDSLSAKNVSKSVKLIENLGFDVWFWPETIKENQNIQDFYLLKIKPYIK